MRAITVQPGTPGSAEWEEVPEPGVDEGSVLVEAIAVGVCGTDAEIVEGKYGWAPPGKTRLVLGHESLGRVLDPGPGQALGPATSSSASSGVPIRCRVRTAPSASGTCAATGIHRTRHQGDRRVHVRALAHRAGVRDQGRRRRSASSVCCSSRPRWWPRRGSRCSRCGQRAFWEPRTVLVTGAGPIGLLAALIGKQHGLDVHVLDRVGAAPSRTSCAHSARRITRGTSPTSASSRT